MKKLLTASVALIALAGPVPAFAQDDGAQNQDTAPQSEETEQDAEQGPEQDTGTQEEEPINFEEPAPQGPPAPDSIAYSVNGQDYTFAQMLDFARLLVPNLEQYDISLIYPILTDLAVEQILAAEKARELGLDMTPELQANLQLIINSVLSNAYLEQQIEAGLTPKPFKRPMTPIWPRLSPSHRQPPAIS